MALHARSTCFLALILQIPLISYAAAPIAVDDTRGTIQNTPLTIDVIGNDVDPDGDTLSIISVSTPANGTVVQVSGRALRYTPQTGYSGQDTFTYSISDGTSEPTVSATVTITVQALRIAPLGRNNNEQSIGEALDKVCTTLQFTNQGQLNPGTAALKSRCEGLYQLTLFDPNAVPEVLRQIAPEEVFSQAQIGNTFARGQNAAVQGRLQQLRGGARGISIQNVQLTSKQSGGSAGDEVDASRWGIFFNAQSKEGENDADLREHGFDYEGNNITAGLDYRLNSQWVFGAAYGHTEATLDYAGGGGQDTSNQFGIAYSTLYLESWHLDGVIGAGAGETELARRIAYQDSISTIELLTDASTESVQHFLNLSVGYDKTVNFLRHAINLSPFASVELINTKIDAFGEKSGGGLEIEFNKQDVVSKVVSTGLKVDSPFSFQWGVFNPYIQAALKREVEQSRDPLIGRFAFDPDPNNLFQLENNKNDTFYQQLTLGASFVLRHGISAYLDYEKMLGLERYAERAFNVGARWEVSF